MNSKEISLKPLYRKYLIRIVILIIFNVLGFAVLINDGRSISERFWVALEASIVGFNIVGFVLGLLVSLIPFKGLSFGKKYLRSSLLTIYIIHIILAVMLISLIPLIFLGVY